MSQVGAIPARSPLYVHEFYTMEAFRRLSLRDRSTIFLLHIVLEGPLAFQGWWNPASLPFLGLNNTTLVFIKVCAHYLLVANILD